MYSTIGRSVASIQPSLLEIGLLKIEGYFNGNTEQWLHILDTCATPSTGDVPVEIRYLPGAAPFSFVFPELRVTDGLFIGVSSTQDTWTASASTMDINVQTKEQPLSATLKGDRTSTVSNLVVWADPGDYGGLVTGTAPRLYKVRVTAGADGFVMLNYRNFAASPTPLFWLPGSDWVNGTNLLKSGVTKTFHFNGGINVYGTDAQGTKLHSGCYIGFSSTIPTVTMSTNAKIEAVYV